MEPHFFSRNLEINCQIAICAAVTNTIAIARRTIKQLLLTRCVMTKLAAVAILGRRHQ